MDRLFRDDWQDGSLEQLLLLPTPLVAVVLVKVVAHWMMSGLPLLIVSPLAALLLGMSLHDAGVLALTFAARHPDAQFSRRGGGWPDGRPEARRRPAEPAGAAAGGAAADFRHRGLPGGGRWAPGQRLSGDAGGVLNRQRHPVPVRHRRRAAADRAIIRCACGRGHHNRVSKRLCGKRYINWRSPSGCNRLCGCWIPWLAALSALLLVIGLGWGFGFAPADYQQGESYRIMYLHVPAAMWSMGLYLAMAVAAFVGVVWQIKMADLAIAALAPVGAVCTLRGTGQRRGMG